MEVACCAPTNHATAPATEVALRVRSTVSPHRGVSVTDERGADVTAAAAADDRHGGGGGDDDDGGRAFPPAHFVFGALFAAAASKDNVNDDIVAGKEAAAAAAAGAGEEPGVSEWCDFVEGAGALLHELGCHQTALVTVVQAAGMSAGCGVRSRILAVKRRIKIFF